MEKLNNMDNLPVVVKDILESADLQKIKKVDLKNIGKEALIGKYSVKAVLYAYI